MSHWYPCILWNRTVFPQGRAAPTYPCQSYQRPYVNVNVNIDFCFTLSCELVARLPNLKRWKLSIVHIPGRWRGGRWIEKCQLGRSTNQRWGAQSWTHQKYFLAEWFVNIPDFLTDNTFFRLEKPCCELVIKQYREILTNQTVLYTCLTYVKPYQNILDHFPTKMQFWWLV